MYRLSIRPVPGTGRTVWRDDGQVPIYPGTNYACVQQRPIPGKRNVGCEDTTSLG